MSLHDVVDRATWAAKHPLSATAHTVGVLKGAAGLAVGVLGRGRDLLPGRAAEVPDAEPKGDPAARIEAQRATVVPSAPAAPQREPEPVHESFTTEPTAVTRTSDHGGRGRDAEIDDWRGDVELDLDPDADPATGSVVEALERGDGLGDPVDHAAIKSVLNEAERNKQ